MVRPARLIGDASWSGSPRPIEALTLSAMIFEDIRARWAAELGADRLDGVAGALREMVPGETFRLDVPGWFGS